LAAAVTKGVARMAAMRSPQEVFEHHAQALGVELLSSVTA
jgi:hypothetical protein